MLNNLNKELNKMKKAGNKNSNDFSDPALLEAEQLILRAKHDSQPASDNFKENLKSEIMKSRQKQQKNMPNLSQIFGQFLKPKFFVPVLAFVLIVAVFMTSVLLWPNQPGSQGPYKFTSLFINTAYAQDNFEVTATNQDSTGIDSGTSFIIKSKDLVDPSLLKDNIILTPTAEFDFEKINDYEFKVTPTDQLNNKTIYNLEIEAAYYNENGIAISRDFSWAFQVKDQFKITHSLPADQSSSVPTNSGIEFTFTHDNVDIKDFEKHFSISPSVSGRFEQHKRTFVFVPKSLQSGTIYTVTLEKGLAVIGSDQTLTENYQIQFETKSSNAKKSGYTNFVKDHYEVGVGETPVLQISYSYKETEEPETLQVYRFSSSQDYIDAFLEYKKIPYWASYSKDSFNYNFDKMEKIGDFQALTYSLGYNRYLVFEESFAEGQYLVTWTKDEKTVATLLQVTDLSAYVQSTVDQTVVWVNSLTENRPVDNAKVSLIGSPFSETTNSQGIVLIDNDKYLDYESYNQVDHILKVERNGQVVILPYFTYYTDTIQADNEYWNYFYTDRYMYQPNDIVNYFGFIKPRGNQDEIKEISVELTRWDYFDYNYQTIVYAQDTSLVDNNFFQGQINLHALTPATYFLTIKADEQVLKQEYIVIEEYQKPTYNLSVDYDNKVVFANDTVNFDLTTQFFDGTPTPNVKLEMNVGSQRETKTTDELGKTSTSYKVPAVTDCNSFENYCNYPETIYADFTSANFELGEVEEGVELVQFNALISAQALIRNVSENKAKAIVDIKNYDIEKIKQGVYYWEEEALSDPASDVKFEAKIYETITKKVENGEYYDFINKISRKQYTYEKVTTREISFQGITDQAGNYEYEFDINPTSNYQVVIIASDKNGRHERTSAYYYPQYAISDQDYYSLNFTDEIDVYNKKAKLGEEVSVVFSKNNLPLPLSQNENYLYFQLQNGLLDYQLSTDSTYSFEFKEKHVPNVHLDAVYFDGNTYHPLNLQGFYSMPRVSLDATEKELEIEIKTDKESYKPGEQATIQVHVTDKKGKGVVAGVNLNLIDEAYYKLASDYVDPIAELYTGLPSGSLGNDFTHEQPIYEVGMAEGGGCFVAGTSITMADGSQKPIEDIESGELVYTYENESLQKKVSASVLKTFEHAVTEYLIINNNLKVTPEHVMFVNHGWQTIGEAKIGDYLTDQNGHQVVIDSIEKIQDFVMVYNLNIENQHTYFANNYYVHNDKGSAVRQNFVDMALFQTIQTDNLGTSEVTFTLPDNITSWRITAQAISDNLSAGYNSENLIVSKTMFGVATFVDEYLVKDKPELKMRAFGTALKTGDQVDFEMTADSLNIDSLKKSANAFQPVYFDLPELVVGKHDLKITTESAHDDDVIIMPITVLASRQSKLETKYYDLTSSINIENENQNRTTLTFSDQNQGRFYNDIRSLSWGYGDRIDQKLSRVVSAELMNKFFEQENYIPEVNASSYQTEDGGVSLLPYSDQEYELTAKIADLAAEKFDKSSLAKYFYDVLGKEDSNREEISVALYGLASLNETVLLEIQNFAKLEDLTVKEKLYTALAAYKIGDKELARKLYLQVIDESGEDLSEQYRIKAGQDQDDYLMYTALAVNLAGGLNDQHAKAMWSYLENNYTKDILIKLEKALYLQKAISHLIPGEVSFSYELNGKKENKTLSLGATYTLSLTAEQLQNITFSDIIGNVGVVSEYAIPLVGNEQVSDYVNVQRKYFVNGKETTTFNENDIVEIRLYPKISKDAVDGGYQIVDLLPSSWIAVTDLYRRGLSYDTNTYYPYEIVGQEVKFMLNKYSRANNNYFKYYARIVNPGEYLAEPVLIQSTESQIIKNYSQAISIKINSNE